VVRKWVGGLLALTALLMLGCGSATGQSADHETAAVRSACYQVSQLDIPPARSGQAENVLFSTKDIDEILHSGNGTLSKAAADLVRASNSGNAKLAIQAIGRGKAFCHSLVK
jgi:hypothetical protein